jgi:hypothetical protein
MTSGRPWLLVALAVVAIGCLVPGSMISEQAALSGTGSIIEAAAPSLSGSECAAVSCQHGSPSSPAPVPALALAGAIAALTLVVLSVGAFRRSRPVSTALPAGIPVRLLRPPQPTRSA